MSVRSETNCENAKNGDDFWGNVELAAFATTLLIMAIIVPTSPIHFINWRFILFFLPFWYLGHCFSYLNGYYRHYGANPDKPIAWGVSSYGKIYNWLFFYNGYHAEHHFRPKVHWTKMEKFRRSIEHLQKQEGVRTIKRAHMLGFLDPDLPKRGENARAKPKRRKRVVGQAHRLPSGSPLASGALALQIFRELSAQFFFSCFALLL